MSEDVAWSDAILEHLIKLYLIVAVFRVLYWALIYILRLRFSPGSPLTKDLLNIDTLKTEEKPNDNFTYQLSTVSDLSNRLRRTSERSSSAIYSLL